MYQICFKLLQLMDKRLQVTKSGLKNQKTNNLTIAEFLITIIH